MRKWVPVEIGSVKVNDKVRVRIDAYIGDNAWRHNARRGYVVAARNGLVIVAYNDGSAFDAHHPPGMLEREVDD